MWLYFFLNVCSQTSNISYALVGNKIVDHSDVVGASPVGATPTTSSGLVIIVVKHILMVVI